MIEILEHRDNMALNGYIAITQPGQLRGSNLTHIIVNQTEKAGKVVGSAEILAKSEELNHEV